MKPVLYQFAFSHFNEKARWALDWKGIAHVRKNVLPGPHAKHAQAISGAPTTPYLVLDSGDVVSGSAEIVRRVDLLSGGPSLYPDDPEARAEVDRWIDWLDEEVGTATRLGLFYEIFQDPSFAALVFTTGQPFWKAIPYRRMFPRLIPLVAKRITMNQETAGKANTTIREALERIETATHATGYLVGDRFSAADLTAASLLFPLAFPKELSFGMPSRPSPHLDAWTGKWAESQGVTWMQKMFREHRNTRPTSIR
jgi:glutathione S-transferase